MKKFAFALATLALAAAPSVFGQDVSHAQSFPEVTHYVVITPGGGFVVWNGGDIWGNYNLYQSYISWQNAHPFLTIYDWAPPGGQKP